VTKSDDWETLGYYLIIHRIPPAYHTLDVNGPKCMAKGEEGAMNRLFRIVQILEIEKTAFCS
jgi:hypothetical protein